MERLIYVTGVSNLSFTPDLTIVKLRFSGWSNNYQDCMNKAALDVSLIRNMLEVVGLDKKLLKTESYDIETHQEKVYYNNGEDYKYVNKGFDYYQTLKFSFNVSNDTLSKVINAISSLDLNPQFNLSFSVRDLESAKDKLIDAACKDAIKKAKLIASSSNIVLGNIVKIDYSKKDYDFDEDYELGSRPRSYGCKIANIDIEPDDIVKACEVNMVFEIKD